VKTENRHWLILSYFSRIDGMACAQHIDDRLPYLRKSGISPIMLTSVCATRHEGLVHRRVPSVAPSGIRYELRHLRRRSRVAKVLAPLINVLSLPFYLIEKIIVDLDSQWSWFPLAAWRGRALCREFAPELIYSTGGASSAHVAAFIISRMTGIPWIAELQDPLVYGDSTRSRRAQRLYGGIVSLMCRHASAVVFLTEEARRRAAASTELGDKGRVIYPGADPAIMPDAPISGGSAAVSPILVHWEAPETSGCFCRACGCSSRNVPSLPGSSMSISTGPPIGQPSKIFAHFPIPGSSGISDGFPGKTP